MGMNKPDIDFNLYRRRTHMLFDDFDVYVSTDVWTTVVTGSSTAASSDNEGGWLVLTGDTTPNDAVYVKSTQKTFKFVNNNPVIVECALQYTEANTNQAAIMFGFTDSVVAASTITNATGEPAASFSGAVIYKVPSTQFWKTKSSVGSTSPGANISTTVPGTTAFQRLQIAVMPVSSTIAEVTYFVDGIQLMVAGQRAPIKDQLTYTGAAAMNLFIGSKQVSASVAEVVNVDYMAADQLRFIYT